MASWFKSLFTKEAPEEQLVPVFIPPLATILVHEEKKKGCPLTEEEVIAIRGRSTVMMMRSSMAAQMEEKRGYRDINPEFCWLEWCVVRKTLADEKRA